MARAHVDGSWLRQQCASISDRAGSPSIDLIDITTTTADAVIKSLNSATTMAVCNRVYGIGRFVKSPCLWSCLIKETCASKQLAPGVPYTRLQTALIQYRNSQE